MTIVLLLVLLAVTLAIGMPIAWGLAASSIALLLVMGLPLSLVAEKIFSGVDHFPFMAIPLFILAGEFMSKGGITKNLLNFAVMLVGGIRGGLALATVLSSMLFSGITGSASADTSAVGSVGIPMLVKNGYDRPFSAALTAASAVCGPLIPPSNLAIIYAMIVGGVSVGGLFLACAVPGLLIGAGLMAAAYVISVKRKYPVTKQRIAMREFLICLRDASLALVAPIIVLGGILAGIFTPTEAAAVAAMYSFLICHFVFRQLPLSALPDIFLRAGAVTAVVMIIIGTSNLFGTIIAYERLAETLEGILHPLGIFGFLLAVNIIFLILGTFLESDPALIIFAPVFAPIAITLGIDPLHFGAVVIINLAIGMITPPVGVCLFIAAPLAGVSLEQISRAVLPFVMVETAILFLVTYFPIFTLGLPALIGMAY